MLQSEELKRIEQASGSAGRYTKGKLFSNETATNVANMKMVKLTHRS